MPRFNCGTCGRLYIIPFRRGGSIKTSEQAVTWINAYGWVLVGPPARFYCGEDCHAESAKLISAPPLQIEGRVTP